MLALWQVGSADHHIHYFDLRNASVPLYTFKGHRKAVSYVKFVSPTELASASTDNTLRLWDVQKDCSVSDCSLVWSLDVFFQLYCSHISCLLYHDFALSILGFLGDSYVDPSFFLLQLRTLRGHTNEKNFVGLSVNNEYIACGSETNEVFVYHKVRLLEYNELVV